MKNILLKFSSLLLIGAMILPTGAYASSSNDSISEKPEVEGEIVQAYRVTDNGMVELSKEEIQAYKALEETNNNAQMHTDFTFEDVASGNNEIITPNAINEYYWRYIQTTFKPAVPMTSLTKRISTYVYNETLDPAKRTISSSTSQTWSANFGLSFQHKKAVSTTLGGSWSKTTSFADVTESTVRARHMSWAEFTPIMDKSFGYLNEIYSFNGSVRTKKYTEIYTARELGNGQADGILVIKTAPY
ncbi:hypothetical protein HUB98_24495 [Paenibacillus barcinonensis]|uniref:Toxin ETX/toxin MTX2 n=1 Tax=Paenibacillus barcinonensis TaxID=198119 RepID=A0A2V4VNV0_PAEBA|nr:hypothetical protein [Paenibacillus barcinonensis]PYE47853.1 hypothetical protein DFQ00_111152 [Paenibacillus barcinonensis]QKS59054.1 hypothetical protein HUB98_24495 [Paenibacillus barcinonensis]